MIFNVLKMAEGSAFQVASIRQTIPLLPEGAVVSPGSSGMEAASSKKGKSGLIDDSLLKEIMTHGLPNEVNLFLTQLASYERDLQMGLPTSRSLMYSLLSMVNTIINNKLLFDTTLKLAEKQDCMSDYALRQDGALYVRENNGTIKAISLAEYDKNKDNYQVMTYGDLANQRMYNNNQSFDTSILETIHSATGLNKVQEHVWKIVRALGSHDVSQADYESIMMVAGRDLQNPSKREREGFEELLKAYQEMGPTGLFKVLEEHKSPDIEAAFNYIWLSLPNNYKKCLLAKSIIENGIDSNPATLIASALGAGVSTTDKYNVSFKKTTNTATGATSSKNQVSLTPVERLFNADENRTKVTFSDSEGGNQNALTLYASTMPQITDDRGNSIANATLYDALMGGKGNLGKYLDFNSTYIGNKKVDGRYLLHVIYDGSTVANAWVPVDASGNIDLQKFKKFLQAQEIIKEKLDELDNENLDNSVILLVKNSVYKEMGLDIHENPDGSYSDGGTKMGRYLIMYGSFEDNDVAKGNWLAHELTGQAEYLENEYAAGIYGLKNTTSSRPGWWHRAWNDTYKAPVFIKIKDFAAYDASAYAGHGSLVTKNTLAENMARQNLLYPLQLRPTINGGSSVLNE